MPIKIVSARRGGHTHVIPKSCCSESKGSYLWRRSDADQKHVSKTGRRVGSFRHASGRNLEEAIACFIIDADQDRIGKTGMAAPVPSLPKNRVKTLLLSLNDNLTLITTNSLMFVTDYISSRLIYPNPFQPTGIEFELLEDAVVTVKILDETGQVVETLIDHDNFSAGKQMILIDHKKYSNGKFFYQISLEMEGRNLVDTRQIK